MAERPPHTDSTDPAPSGYLTITEVAARLRIGRTAAYALVRNGQLSVVRIGRALRVPAHEIWEYERDRTTPALRQGRGRRRQRNSVPPSAELPPARRHIGVKK